MASEIVSPNGKLRSRTGAGALLAVILLCGTSWAERPGEHRDIEADRAVEVRIEIGDRSELASLTRLVGIDDVRGLVVRATATPEQLEELGAAGYAWEILPAPAKAAGVVMCPEGWVNDEERSWSCYPSYPQYVALMQRFVTVRPALCRLVDLGPGANTVSPHRLLAVVITDNPDLAEDEPEVLLTSSMHGDEAAGFVLMLRLIHHLLDGYGEDPEITRLVDETEIWINPSANPDGTYFGGDDSVADAIRYFTTSSGSDSFVDPNRNFPSPRYGPHPDHHEWWPETEAMMALAETQTFVLSANLHGGAEVLNYPWDSFARRHPDDAWFEDLSRDYADLAHADSPGGYLTDLDDGITNGWDWYETQGSRQDWMTFYQGGREITAELSEAKLLPADQLDGLWQWNRRALLDFIAHAQGGIRGVVSDRFGRPLAATVEVVGVDRAEDGSTVRTDPEIGDYHRLLLPGLYDLRFAAEGFQSRLVEGVAVADGAASTVDIVLYEELIRRPSRRVAP
jgi:hypothetical protein